MHFCRGKGADCTSDLPIDHRKAAGRRRNPDDRGVRPEGLIRHGPRQAGHGQPAKRLPPGLVLSMGAYWSPTPSCGRAQPFGVDFLVHDNRRVSAIG